MLRALLAGQTDGMATDLDLDDVNRRFTAMRRAGEAADRLMQMASGVPHRKAAVTATGTGDIGIVEAMQPIVDMVAKVTIFGRLRALGALDAPANLPIPVPDSEPLISWLSEGAPLPVARVTTSPVTLTPQSYGTLLPVQRELIRLGDGRARNLILALTRRTLQRAEDSALLSTDAATGGKPAGLLHNVVQIGLGSPATSATIGEALDELYAVVTDGRAERPVFILSGRVALFLAATAGDLFRDVRLDGTGNIAGAPALVTPAAGASLILIDAAELATLDAGLDAANSGASTIQMLDDPTNNSATATATTTVSAFQTGTSVLRFIRYLNWAKLRDDAVGAVDLSGLIGGSPA